MKLKTALLIGLSFGGCGIAHAQPAPKFDIVLSPHASPQRVEYIDVRLTLEAPAAETRTVFLDPPQRMPDIDGPEYDAATLALSDASGKLPFTVNAKKQIVVGRKTVGDVVIQYRAPAHVVTKPAFPPYDLRAEGLSAIGAGTAFLLTPRGKQPYHMRLKWELGEMPAGSFGVWSFGEGSVEHVGPIEHLERSYFGVGPLSHYSSGPFGLYWASEPPFDAPKVGKIADTLFQYYVKFFEESPGSFRAFLRKNGNGGSAGAMTQSFLFDYNASTVTAQRLNDTLAHEMTHTFIGGFPGDANWYAEGTANHYASVLGYRAGIIDADEFIQQVNKDAVGYYALPVRNMSATEADIPNVRDDPAIASLDYVRARIYLSSIDAKIRARSKGRRSLDDITLALLDQTRRGKPQNEGRWLKLIEAELGPVGLQDHKNFLAGKLIVPAPDAFGPCFTRERADVRRFDLGFDRSLLYARPAVIKTVRPNSPGAKAGLLDGDEIVSSNVGDAYKNPTVTITLKIKRGDTTKDVTFLPRGEELLEAYRWVRVASVPANACAI